MRIMDIQSVVQNARVAEQVQAQVQQAQEFAKTLLAQESQNERQQQLSTVRNVKEAENPRIESETQHRRGSTGGKADDGKKRQASPQPIEDKSEPTSESGDSDEGRHIDILA